MPASVTASSTIGDQLADLLTQVGPIAFYLAVWGLVFVGTALFVGVFVPFITGDSLLFAAGIATATNDRLSIWILATGVGVAAFAGDQVGFVLGRHFGRPYLSRRRGRWVQAGHRAHRTLLRTVRLVVRGGGQIHPVGSGVRSSRRRDRGHGVLAIPDGQPRWRRVVGCADHRRRLRGRLPAAASTHRLRHSWRRHPRVDHRGNQGDRHRPGRPPRSQPRRAHCWAALASDSCPTLTR